MIWKSFLILVFLLLSSGLITCDMDKGLSLLPTIEGSIILDSIDAVGEAEIGDVVVVVAPDFPPKNWTDIIKTPPLIFNTKAVKDTINYKVPLNPGTYAVVAVLWKPKDQEWSFETISNILGVYTEPNLFKPKEVTIGKNDTVVTDVNIFADFGFVRSGAFIKGKITYDKNKASFNPNTEMMILASFPHRPSKVIDYLFAMGWDLTIPIHVTDQNDPYNPYYEFTLDVSPGNHKFIALFWKGSKGSPYDFKRIADFEIPNIDPVIQIGTLKYEGKRVRKGETFKSWVDKETGETKTITLEADFSKTY
jgi:hypothetical protein